MSADAQCDAKLESKSKHSKQRNAMLARFSIQEHNSFYKAT